MKAPPLPPDEAERLAALRRYRVLDTLPEKAFDDLARLASYVMKTPMALVSLVDQDRQWFKARFGIDGEESERRVSFCGHAILERAPMVVPNALEDERFFDNPNVTGDPNVRFYAGAPLVVEGDHAIGTLCAFSDTPATPTDEQLELLAALARQVVAQLELRLRLQEEQDTNMRLSALQAMKQEFYNMVTHDLRTPLTALSGSLTLLAAGLPASATDEIRLLLDIARRNTERTIEMVGDLLDLEQIEQKALVLERVPIDLNDLASASLALNETYLSAASARFVLEPCDRPVMVRGDKRRLLQVLDNLLSNALKHAPGGTNVTVRVRHHEDEGEGSISVCDQGPGIPADLRPRIFERYSQSEIRIPDQGSTRKVRSTGLGLYVAHRIVQAHDGDLGFECPDQGGTVFTIRLPVCPDS